MKKILYIGRSEHARHYLTYAQSKGFIIDFVEHPPFHSDVWNEWI
ncbi:hypothetical protein [Xenorhabdus ishibashii]|uniref:Uncharacterized protein n=1 Tax=Xenorhabdus ishibashii TaxID=1034471 RepID=A0A2D0KE73_9GAMM|nr:hypothetical protein [Xenorhabdus ishibashii]PHM61682.1 hypothetical protein Xish_00821 [Xenorhabdus ishibashii]